MNVDPFNLALMILGKLPAVAVLIHALAEMASTGFKFVPKVTVLVAPSKNNALNALPSLSLVELLQN